MNILEERADDLVPVDYTDLLSHILKMVQSGTTNLFTAGRQGNYLGIDIDTIAQNVAQNAKTIRHPLGRAGRDVRVASIHVDTTRDRFVSQIKELRQTIQGQVAEAIKVAAPELTPVDFVRRMIRPLQDVVGSGTELGLHYPFTTAYTQLHKQRLTVRPTGERPILRFHKLTLTVAAPEDLSDNLVAGLNHYIDQDLAAAGCNDQDIDDLHDILQQLQHEASSDLTKLWRLVNTEAIGKLKREAQICYLEFLRDNLGAEGDGPRYLADLIRRLRLLDQYLLDPARDDGQYEVSYGGTSANYRDLFAPSDVLNRLPIITVVQGSLGETTDPVRNVRTFVFGLKLKLGGRVSSQGTRKDLAFDYYLGQIDPESVQHRERLNVPFKAEGYKRRVLMLALLYDVVFRRFGDLTFDPIAHFETMLLPVLQGDDEQATRAALHGLANDLRQLPVRNAVTMLRRWLRKQLRDKHTFTQRSYPAHVVVRRGILATDIDRIFRERTFFKPILGENPKAALRYLTIGDPGADADALCKLGADLTISPLQYYLASDEQQFSMSYDIAGREMLPVLIAPRTRSNKLYQKYFQKKYSLLTMPYTTAYLDICPGGPESWPAFVYRFTFALLSYTCLSVLLEPLPRDLFVPIVRLQEGNHLQSSEQDSFIRNITKVVTHLLNEDHCANTQGFDVQQQLEKEGSTLAGYKVRNGLSSLYAALPKRFTLAQISQPQLDRLAIVTVSSRECDRRRNGVAKLASLIGEVVGVERQPDGSVKVALLHTFSDIFDATRTAKPPRALVDQIGVLYERGYRHVIYIAKSPYTSTLHVTDQERDDYLFFMSRPIIKAFKEQRSDLKLYPVFFDMYSVLKLPDYPNTGLHSLYIQDTQELTRVHEDPNKRAVVFFNLFNGVEISGDSESKFYNGVMSYATLLNMYEGILDDQDLWEGLLLGGNGPSLKTDLLHYLTLFHFARYEADPRRKGGMSLKLDPYQHLIGDDSVGAQALMMYGVGGATFNVLAFLTHVRQILRGQRLASKS